MNRLLLHLEFNNLLPQNQFGFRPGRSTQHSILLAREAIRESQQQRRTVLIATRDVSKAFDTVWLEGLLFKANVKLNLDINFTAFLYNYSFGRKATPMFDSKSGYVITPKAGVPQGSCLGPILYLMYVSDSPSPLYNDTLVVQFADDNVQIVRSDSTGPNRATSAQLKLRRELKNQIEWERKWKIQTSWEKCSVGYSGTSRPTLEDIGGIVVLNHHFQINNDIKILGFTFTNFCLKTPMSIT